ncbi:MAG: molybdopterin molybdenumtransferase MoeA [Phycisphaerales bacterium]|nr:molybdopterin molybdenumtransferase MoeA [Phycisphaerales bacterium]
MATAATMTGFRGEAFAFDSPAAAIAAVTVHRGSVAHGAEEVALSLALGRILASDTRLTRDSPPFDYSAMDGYAVGPACVGTLGSVAVVGESLIGQAPPPLTGRDAAIRISTGAPMPSGADRVIRREDVTELTDAQGAVVAIEPAAGVMARVATNENVRHRGENARAGSVAVFAGRLLTCADLGTLCAAGVARAQVVRRLRVATITTGDELAEPGSPVADHAIHNSNSVALAGLLGAQRWIDAAPACHVRDDSIALDEPLRRAADECDAVLLTGGVSMGHRDGVRSAIERLSARLIFHGLPQRPGKPMLAGMLDRHPRPPLLIFGLPGNPVSAMVTLVRIALPALAAHAGATRWPDAPAIMLANDDGRRLDLWWHRLVRIRADGEADLIDLRGSGDVVGASGSDGFVELAPRSSTGTPVPYFPWPR